VLAIVSMCLNDVDLFDDRYIGLTMFHLLLTMFDHVVSYMLAMCFADFHSMCCIFVRICCASTSAAATN
jgi:hypothetical protein